MAENINESIWKVQKAKMLKKFSFLTEDDLNFRDGNKDAMLEKLQITLCLNGEELKKVFANL